MGRHASGRIAPRPGGSDFRDLRFLLSVPICLCLGVYALFWGISMVANPQTCDLKVMTSADLCQPETRGRKA